MEKIKITFVIPSRNNLEFLQLAYKSIRNLDTKHEILVLNDASTDGTQEWINNLNDPDLITHHNTGPERIGIVGMFDKGIEMARTKIIFAFHADMVAAPNLDKHILKHLKKGTIISATRVEPPLHPDGPEKMLVDFGVEVEDFNIDKFNNWVLNEYKPKHNKNTTEGIFAPWCMYKEDFLAIGGHDELFAPQSKEDSDLFNRFVLNGYKILQTWEGLVYHFTSRGSRFNKHAGGAAGRNSNEWLHTTTKNMRNFIRKWGTVVKHDALMKPIISPKYSIGIKVENCTSQLLEALEPWCDKIYVDEGNIPTIIKNYINLEQPKTNFNLQEKIHTTGNLSDYTNNGFFPTDIFIEINGNTFSNQDYSVIQQFSEIIQDSGEIGEFELGNLKITINSLKEYQNKLIKNKIK
jgi:glycosyltransferase involved in cell wall biosynthesis